MSKPEALSNELARLDRGQLTLKRSGLMQTFPPIDYIHTATGRFLARGDTLESIQESLGGSTALLGCKRKINWK